MKISPHCRAAVLVCGRRLGRVRANRWRETIAGLMQVMTYESLMLPFVRRAVHCRYARRTIYYLVL
jgi:hypothetical protein